MEDEYGAVAPGKLKLKKDAEISKKKKKKKRKDESKEKKKMEKLLKESVSNNTCNNSGQQQQTSGRRLTKAELSFKQMQDKMQKKRILEKAVLTHKQRVEKFNEHLDGLTEHFDIPKVSWTK